MSDGKLADQLFHHHDEPCYGMYCSSQTRTFLHRETHFMESSYYFSKNAFNVISILQFARKRVFNTEIICAAAYVSKIYLLYEGTGQVP